VNALSGTCSRQPTLTILLTRLETPPVRIRNATQVVDSTLGESRSRTDLSYAAFLEIRFPPSVVEIRNPVI